MSVRRSMVLSIALAAALVVTVKWALPSVRAAGFGPAPRAAEAVAALEREVEAIGAAIREAQDLERLAPLGKMAWPTPGHLEVSSPYGMRRHPVLKVEKLHTGVDIAAPGGAPVVAAAAGRVVLVAQYPAYGWVVAVDHGGGVSTVYAHLSDYAVEQGEMVERGERLGLVGETGQVTGPHLHVEVRRDGVPVEPLF